MSMKNIAASVATVFALAPAVSAQAFDPLTNTVFVPESTRMYPDGTITQRGCLEDKGARVPSCKYPYEFRMLVNEATINGQKTLAIVPGSILTINETLNADGKTVTRKAPNATIVEANGSVAYLTSETTMPPTRGVGMDNRGALYNNATNNKHEAAEMATRGQRVIRTLAQDAFSQAKRTAIDPRQTAAVHKLAQNDLSARFGFVGMPAPFAAGSVDAFGRRVIDPSASAPATAAPQQSNGSVWVNPDTGQEVQTGGQGYNYRPQTMPRSQPRERFGLTGK